MKIKDRKLLVPERETLILDLLSEKVKTLPELSESLGVSSATVRRDLISLEEQGRIHRVHGGAVRAKLSKSEPIFDEKANLKMEEKNRIAELALDFIENSDTVYLDGGSTILRLAKLLSKKESISITVITNSLMAAAEFMESPHKLILVGGEFRAISRTIVGVLTANTINSLHIDKAFLGTIGFSLQDGISTTDPNEAYTKELIMKRSGKNILMADSSKLCLQSFATSGKLEDINTLITDSGISPNMLKELKKKKIEVIY